MPHWMAAGLERFCELGGAGAKESTIFFKPMAPDWTMVGASWLTGLVIFQLGFCIFMRLRRRFADVV